MMTPGTVCFSDSVYESLSCLYIYTLLYADMATRIYTEGEGHVHALYLHVSACVLPFSILVRNADASRHDKAEGPEPPRLNTYGLECPDGISTSCP